MSARVGVAHVSYGSNPFASASIVARSDSESSSAVATVLRDQVRAIDPALPRFDVMTLDALLAGSNERVGLRVFGTMFVVFALVALLLATVGLYALTAYAAAQRTREIGVRLALGAQASQIWWFVTRGAAWQLGLGLSIGMAAPIAIGDFLGSVLAGAGTVDPVTMFAARDCSWQSVCLRPARRRCVYCRIAGDVGRDTSAETRFDRIQTESRRHRIRTALARIQTAQNPDRTESRPQNPDRTLTIESQLI